MTTMGDALRKATGILDDAGIENARAEARLLMGFVQGLSAAQVFARENETLDDKHADAFELAVKERTDGKPLAHITGEREFWSLPFKVSPATLIPRPDTESVIELAIKWFAAQPKPSGILDLGTGSGCLLLALLKEFPNASGCGVDVSEDAVAIATENMTALGLKDRASIMHTSWEDLPSETYDLVVSNPPYIPTPDIDDLETTVRDFEPVGALDGGADGLDAYRSLFECMDRLLDDEGLLIVEIGIGQASDVTQLAQDAGLESGPRQTDIAGIERALSFYKKGVGITGARG